MIKQKMLTIRLEPFSNKQLLQAYACYLEILMAAYRKMLNPRTRPRILLDGSGSCAILQELQVNYALVVILNRTFTQTSRTTFPVANGNYFDGASWNRWKGVYGQSRIKFLEDCANGLKTELTNRGYNL